MGALLPSVEVGCQGRVENVHDTADAKSKQCVECHASAYKATTDPVHEGLFPQTCKDCHNTTAWVPGQMSPDQHKWFPLQNKHSEPACRDCHTKGFKQGDTPNDCQGCHRKDYDAAKNPVHTGFPTDCKLCHNDLGWQPSIFQHPWPLLNKHAKIACTDCHKGGVYQGTQADCAACHDQDYQDAKNPIHLPIPPTTGMLIQGGRTCEDCHTSGGDTGGWRPTKFVHPDAPFKVDGVHATVACNDCHQAPTKPAGATPRGYDKTKIGINTCYDCHIDDFKSTDNAGGGIPKHSTNGFTVPVSPVSAAFDCRLCHSDPPASPWTTGQQHDDTKFILNDVNNKHHGINCTDCHTVGTGKPSWGGQNVSCVTCHGYANGVWKPANGLSVALDTFHTDPQQLAMPACGPTQVPTKTTQCFPIPAQLDKDPVTSCRVCHVDGTRSP